jgi:release factor glutamine methyltransferase
MLMLRNYIDLAEVRLRKGPHPDRARHDAEALMRFVLSKDRAWQLTHWDAGMTADDAERYDELLNRRAAGEPIQYILGEAEFYGLPFRVTPDVLIPRPETEHVIEKVLELAARFEAPRIVDVGTGSGAIAIALARALPNAQVVAIDFSPRALAVAKENADRNGVADRIRFLCSNLLEPVTGESFDFVVSNPPYVPAGDRESLAVEVRDHEPAIALFAGDDGLDAIRSLIPAAFTVLSPGGFFVMEFGFGQWPAISALIADAGFERIDFAPDLQRIPRVAVARRP